MLFQYTRHMSHCCRNAVLTSIVCAVAIACAPDNPSTASVATEPPAQKTVQGQPLTGAHIAASPSGAVISQKGSSMREDELMAKLAALKGKGPPALVLVERPLANGAIAEVHLNSTGPVPRFLAISRATLDDEIIDRAYSIAKQYEMRNPDEQSPVTFSLAANGDYVRRSNAGEQRGHHDFHGFYHGAKKDRKSRWLLESSRRVPLTDIPGLGPARIMSLGEPK
jgi:hypothetical protein